MVRLLTTSLCAALYSFSFAQCVYCTSMADALINPESVIMLDLRAKGLHELPLELSKCVNLKSIDLSDNFIEEIDFEKLGLPNLEELNLTRNPGFNTMQLKYAGQALPSLKKLDLSECNIKFISPDIAGFKKLEEVDLSDNSIVVLPMELNRLKNVRILDLSKNDLKDAYALRDLWALERLSIDGNFKLDLEQLGMALLLKDDLRYLSISPNNDVKGIPESLAKLDIEVLELKGSSLDRIESKICRNKSLTKVIINGVRIDDSRFFYSWVNNFQTLETLEFRNMEVPKGMSELTNLKKLSFVDCEIKEKAELIKIKPSIRLITVNTDLSTPGYIGNAKIATTSNAKRSVVIPISGPIPSEAMTNNLLPSIMEPEKVSVKIDAAKSQEIELELSAYSIPEKAFLNAQGEVYEGTVDIQITEYSDPVGNALAGVPMTYRTDTGNEIFASSGMIDFKAYDDQGQELQPNPESQIEVKIKDLQPSKDSKLYVYDTTANNWVNVGEPLPSNFDRRKSNYLDSLNKLTPEEILNFRVSDIHVLLDFKKKRYDPYILDFHCVSRGTAFKYSKNYHQVVKSANFDQQWICKKVDWTIDTILTDQIKEVLSNIRKDQRKIAVYYGKKNNKYEDFTPRLIDNIKIAPNFENDNYRMTFEYRDTTVTIPVVANFSGSVTRVQEKEKNNYREYERRRILAEKEAAAIEKYKDNIVTRQAAVVRAQRAAFNAMVGSDVALANQENLRFGLTSFGMYNCDYLSRNIPDEYVAFDTVAVDQNGDWVRIPNDIRNIYLDDNSFVSTYVENVPVFKNRRSIIVFATSAFEIAIVKGWKILSDGFVRPDVERVSTKDMSPDEVRKIILNSQP